MNKMEIIGKGGYGTIYATDDPKLVQKTHFYADGGCESLFKEFTMQRIAYESTKKNTIYGVPKPRQWKLGKNGCSFLMDRIYAPDEGSLSWHLYLAYEYPDFDNIISTPGGAIRGRYLGPGSIIRKIPKINLSDISYYAGLLIGDVQYGSFQTALDTELIIGSYYNNQSEVIDTSLKLFLIDYDQSNPWYVEDPPYEKLAWTLDAEPYWPYPGSPYYDDFERGYMEAAEKYELGDIAIRVLGERV